jgi:microcompartment protein CcmL/EutN
MIKSADIEILIAQTVCPGKYILLFTGKLSDINAAIDTGIKNYEQQIIDYFILGNPAESIFSALYGTTEIGNVEALGIIETYTVASVIVAADQAAKTANIRLMDIRIARGMSGKSYVLFCGDLAAVEASTKKACDEISKGGFLLNYSIIPNPDSRLWETLL